MALKTSLIRAFERIASGPVDLLGFKDNVEHFISHHCIASLHLSWKVKEPSGLICCLIILILG